MRSLAASVFISRNVIALLLIATAHSLRADVKGDDWNNYNALLDRYAAAKNAAKYPEAQRLAERLVFLAEQKAQKQPALLGDAVMNLALVHHEQGHYQDAERLNLRAIAIFEQTAGPEDRQVADALNNLANVYMRQARYPEATQANERALGIREKALGPDHPAVAASLGNLALVHYHQAEYGAAERLQKRALAIREKSFGPNDLKVAANLGNLGNIYYMQNRYAVAESYFERELAIYEKKLGPKDLRVADVLENIGGSYTFQGKHAEAELLIKRALAIHEMTLGENHPKTARSLYYLAILYAQQGRDAEAEAYFERAQRIWEATFGPGHPDVADCMGRLANLHFTKHEYAAAEPLYQRALEIMEKAHGKDHPRVGSCLLDMGNLYRRLKRYSEAEPLIKRAQAIAEKTYGPEHIQVVATLSCLAKLSFDQKQNAEAESYINRAIAIAERLGLDPGARCWDLFQRAVIVWNSDRKKAALDDLRHAMDLAEQSRGETSGAERERAQRFSQFGEIFEWTVATQFDSNDPEEAFRTIDRSRARALLDEMNRTKVDLNAGRSPDERARLEQQEAALRGRIAELEGKLERAASLNQVDTPGEVRNPNAESLRDVLAQARRDLYEHYRDERSTNPIYRDMLTLGSTQPSLDQVRKKLLGADGLGLIYLCGAEGGYLLVVTPETCRLIPLLLDEPSAKALATSAGPLTSARLQEMLIGEQSQGIVPRLARRPKADEALADPDVTARLEALYSVLIPAPERNELTSGKYKRLIVFPDGPLALLPFETLVVHSGQNPEYLLDNGPAIAYGPSASVIYNLAERAVVPAGTRKPVLTVSDPIYPQAAGDQLASRGASALSELTSRSRYAGIGGQLNRLPFTRDESEAVAAAFTSAGEATGKLERELATEGIVRFNVSGRKFIHLACHGLTDQAFGNFFGALALTPGKNVSGRPLAAADDGFLTLPELYELNLKGCELAILSACETNYGPQQRGEGTWALSRGFLVAGARRVVASNWLVDDEAAANLIGEFCNGLARNEKSGASVDYATQLQAAKRFIRGQEKWRSPYYWGTFVLVGPN